MALEQMATPKLLTNPGFLLTANLGAALPAHTSSGGRFTDVWPAAWVRYGATTEGSEFSHAVNVEAITVAEFPNPIAYDSTEQTSSFAFALTSFTLSNYRRAINGGISALVATGTAGAEVTSIKPPRLGTEVRCMLGWESLDGSLRLIAYQTIQGGEVTTSFRRAPDIATIPCSFNFETPPSGDPWEMFTAGTARV